jgi:NADH dehydrogenase
MFAHDDTFLTTILDLLRRLPAYPMFGRGETKLQPVFVEDVAEAAVRAIADVQANPITYECAGPRVYSYEVLLRTIATAAGVRPFLIPLPFFAWQAIASIAEFLPNPPIARTQVELMEVDTVASPQMPGLSDLGITPRTLEEVLPAILSSR